MNQRAGKTYRAAASDGLADMKLKNFFRGAKEMLEEAGYDDAAFYFEQCEDHIVNGKSLPYERKDIARVLGL